MEKLIEEITPEIEADLNADVSDMEFLRVENVNPLPDFICKFFRIKSFYNVYRSKLGMEVYEQI